MLGSKGEKSEIEAEKMHTLKYQTGGVLTSKKTEGDIYRRVDKATSDNHQTETANKKQGQTLSVVVDTNNKMPAALRGGDGYSSTSASTTRAKIDDESNATSATNNSEERKEDKVQEEITWGIVNSEFEVV